MGITRRPSALSRCLWTITATLLNKTTNGLTGATSLCPTTRWEAGICTGLRVDTKTFFSRLRKRKRGEASATVEALGVTIGVTSGARAAARKCAVMALNGKELITCARPKKQNA